LLSFKTRLFFILWLAGFAGVLSFQLVDLRALIAQIPHAADQPLPMSFTVLRILTVVQSAVFLAAAVFVGVLLSAKVGLSAPAAEAVANGRRATSAIRHQLLPGLLGAVVGGAAIILSWVLWKPFLPLQFVSRAEDFNRMMPPLTRLLYGGITEELLLRWGFMSFLVWATWKVTQKGGGPPRSICFIAAIIVSSVAFGLGHLPIGIAMAGASSLALVSYIVVANASFGLIAGYLYWKKGLESAIIAHMLVHVILLTFLLVAPSLTRP
jgi:membrane protease YdiL (CAAX protease family)